MTLTILSGHVTSDDISSNPK